MMPATDSFWDILSQDDVDFVQAIMHELANQTWAQPIVAGINDNGGLKRENKDRLFELRFAYALHRAGITPRYEIPGEARSHDRFWICIAGPAMGRGAATAGRNAGGEGGNRTQCRRTRRYMERTDLIDGRRGPTQSTEGENTQGRAENLPKMRARQPAPQVSDAWRGLPHDPGGFPDGPERR